MRLRRCKYILRESTTVPLLSTSSQDLMFEQCPREQYLLSRRIHGFPTGLFPTYNFSCRLTKHFQLTMDVQLWSAKRSRTLPDHLTDCSVSFADNLLLVLAGIPNAAAFCRRHGTLRLKIYLFELNIMEYTSISI